MKVLLYDNSIDDIDTFKELLHILPLDTKLDAFISFEQFRHKYLEEEFDIVFIDLNNDWGEELLEFVKKENPNQRVVSISNRFYSAEVNGCEYCKKNYNRFRVIKPLKIDDIKDAILSNKRCEYNFDKEDVGVKLLILSKEFNQLKLNIDDLKFDFKKSSQNLITTEVVKLTQKLAINSIPFEVFENHIQISRV